MIHAYAVDPRLAATWGRREQFRYFHDKFGVGTVRAFLSLPKFSGWVRLVNALADADPSVTDMQRKRLEQMLVGLKIGRCHRQNGSFDQQHTWLQYAQAEHDRCPFSGILSTDNPESHPGVLTSSDIDAPENTRWNPPMALTPVRQPQELANALTPMLKICRDVRFVDPYFGPASGRWSVLVALTQVLQSRCSGPPRSVEVHCDNERCPEDQFRRDVASRQRETPLACAVRIIRWRQRPDGLGERFHNRYVMTELGGVTLGGGLERGSRSQREDST